MLASSFLLDIIFIHVFLRLLPLPFSSLWQFPLFSLYIGVNSHYKPNRISGLFSSFSIIVDCFVIFHISFVILSNFVFPAIFLMYLISAVSSSVWWFFNDSHVSFPYWEPRCVAHFCHHFSLSIRSPFNWIIMNYLFFTYWTSVVFSFQVLTVLFHSHFLFTNCYFYFCSIFYVYSAIKMICLCCKKYWSSFILGILQWFLSLLVNNVIIRLTRNSLWTFSFII